MLQITVLSSIFTFFPLFILRGQSSTPFPNLVVNPSFEQLGTLKKDQVIKVIDTIEAYKAWSSPSEKRSWVYGSDKNGWIEDATNIRGQRNFKARTGQHVAHFAVYGSRGSRSYLQGELIDSLTVGQKYYIGFWSHFHCLATNNIGMAFSIDFVHSDTTVLSLIPEARLREVKNYDAKEIWTPTIDSFVARERFKYFVIGNLWANNSTALGGSKLFDHYTAFIDDVFVVKAKNPVIPPSKKVLPPEPPTPLAVRPPTKINKPSPLPKVLNKVQFRYNSADFEPSSLPQLDSAVVILKNYPTLEILIKGHTSSEGEADYNQKLSKRRAEAVKNYLIQHGIEAKRLIVKGLGKTELLVPDDTEDNKRQNRRIEFVILKE